MYEDKRVTGNECHALDATARPRESGGVLVCVMSGKQNFAGILSQSCNRVGSFLGSWRPPVDEVARIPDLTLQETIERAMRCGIGTNYCKGVGSGADVIVTNFP